MTGKQDSPVLLSIKDVSKVFGGLMALNRVSFDVHSGEIVALIGPNGAGKTTLFNVITNFHPLDGGEILFGGKPLNGLRPDQIAQGGIVRTFQNLRIFHNMTVLENAMVGMHLQGASGIVSAALRLPAAREEEKRFHDIAYQYLEMVGIENRAHDLASSLPFGQQRLLEIGRALAANPRLLLLDEPAAGLTRAETEALDELICSLQDQGLTILLVEHDMELVMNIADWVVVLHYGTKIATGTPEEVQANPDVIGAYLGADWQQDKWLEWMLEDSNPNVEKADA